MPDKEQQLVRSVGLFALVVYGIGDMVGAGIYATIGTAAGQMGNALWMGFAVSMVAALLTGLSYASIASRHPRAGGAAFVTERAFGSPFLAYVLGLTVAASGLTSMATGSRAFSENLQHFIGDVPVTLLILCFLGFLAFVNWWGIRESLWVNLLCTLVETGGVVFIVVVGAKYLGHVDYFEVPAAAGGQITPSLILSGAVLTFFAFIGFEDMLNVAEEVKEPERTLPKGLLIALGTVAVLYILVSLTAVAVVPYAELADIKNGAPFAQITAKAAPWVPTWIFGFITIFAVANTALINFIMGSRLIYGMSRQGLLPAFLGVVHARRKTPHRAIFILAVIVGVLALIGNIGSLASATSLLLLSCFVVMNAALLVLQFRKGEARGRFEIPSFVPVCGILVCLALIGARLTAPGAGWEAPLTALALVAGISALYFVVRPRKEAILES